MISLCITTYNRPDLTIDSFVDVLYDNRISEIIIVDDFSDPKMYTALSVMIEGLREGGGYQTGYHKKLKLHRNDENIGMSRNKAKAIELASNPWCILFDSDNIIDSSYLDALPEYLAPSVIYCPDFAKPQFDYRKYSGQTSTQTMPARSCLSRWGNVF
jgi:glycosyltransferase involved in cell wall biosynthesis